MTEKYKDGHDGHHGKNADSNACFQLFIHVNLLIMLNGSFHCTDGQEQWREEDAMFKISEYANLYYTRGV